MEEIANRIRNRYNLPAKPISSSLFFFGLTDNPLAPAVNTILEADVLTALRKDAREVAEDLRAVYCREIASLNERSK